MYCSVAGSYMATTYIEAGATQTGKKAQMILVARLSWRVSYILLVEAISLPFFRLFSSFPYLLLPWAFMQHWQRPSLSLVYEVRQGALIWFTTVVKCPDITKTEFNVAKCGVEIIFRDKDTYKH